MKYYPKTGKNFTHYYENWEYITVPIEDVKRAQRKRKRARDEDDEETESKRQRMDENGGVKNPSS